MFGYMTKKDRKIANINNRDEKIEELIKKIEELKKKNKAILKESSEGYLETKEVLCESYRKDEIIQRIYELVCNYEFGKTNPYVLIREIKKELDNVWKTNLVQK